MSKLRNSELTNYRRPLDEINGGEINGGETFKFENENGDIVVVTPREVKDVLRQYISDELELYADKTVKRHNLKLSEHVVKNLKIVENKLLEHIDDKINKVCEEIAKKTISRIIEEEVNKRLDAKLKKIKDAL